MELSGLVPQLNKASAYWLQYARIQLYHTQADYAAKTFHTILKVLLILKEFNLSLLQGIMHVEDDAEEEFEIDINEQEPAFLKGQSTKNGAEVSPVKIVANPDGSLQVMILPCRWTSHMYETVQLLLR